MLKPEILKKKTLTLYKAYVMKPGETMTLNPADDTFALNKKDALVTLLENVQDPKDLEAMKGKTISILEISISKTRLEANPNTDDIIQDGNFVRISLVKFTGDYRMKILKEILNNFEYRANPKDNGQTLTFTNIDTDVMK